MSAAGWPYAAEELLALRCIARSVSPPEEQAALLRAYVEPDLLVLDDLFLARRIPEAAGELLQMVVHQRYTHRYTEDDFKLEPCQELSLPDGIPSQRAVNAAVIMVATLLDLGGGGDHVRPRSSTRFLALDWHHTAREKKRLAALSH